MSLSWKPGSETPHDQWYNGDPAKMIAAGTYEYFRPKLQAWVDSGKMPAQDLKWADDLYKERGCPLYVQINFRKFIGDQEEVDRLEELKKKEEKKEVAVEEEVKVVDKVSTSKEEVESISKVRRHRIQRRR